MVKSGFRFKLAAVDLDGTLLGHDGRISPANACALARLQEAGAQVLLASGRHYINMRRYADALPGVQWLVSCQGGEVANVPRAMILDRQFMPATGAQQAMELGRALGFTMVVYAVEGVFTDAEWDSRLQFYTDLSGNAPVRVSAQELLERPIFKIIWMGDAGQVESALRRNEATTLPLQGVRTHARLLEFMPSGVSKGSALKIIATRLGIQPSEAITFGDGDNDVPMFEWAGESVAMAHGWPSALRRATHITPPGPAETALARGVEMVLAR